MKHKTLEQRAKEYCENNIPNLPDMHFTISTAYEAGAADEYRELTEWYDARKTLPELNVQILFKVGGARHIGARYGKDWLSDNGMIFSTEEISGWRFIYE